MSKKGGFIQTKYDLIETEIIENEEGLRYSLKMWDKVVTMVLPLEASQMEECLGVSMPLEDLTTDQEMMLLEYFESSAILEGIDTIKSLELVSIRKAEPAPWVDDFAQFANVLAGFR